MGWIEEAKKAWRPRSPPRSAPTPWFIPSCLKTTRGTETGAVLGFPAEAGEWAAEWAGQAEAGDTRKKSAPTARRFWKEFPRKPADVFLKSPKSSPSRKFTAAFRKNYAISTAWALRR